MSNAWDKFFKGQWTQNKKWDPLTHRAIELIVHQDAHNVGAIDHTISKWTGGDGSTVIGDESRKVEKDPVRGIGRAALTAGAVFGGMYAASAYGGGGGGAGAGAGAGAGVGAGEAGGGAMAIDAGGMGIGQIGVSEMTPALAESAVGSSGYGASSAGAGGAGQFGLSSSQYRQLGQQASQTGERAQADERPITDVDLAALAALAAQEDENQRRMALSTKTAKRPGGNGNSMRLGAANADPIDSNGVQIAAIKELSQRAAALHQRMAAIKAKHKGN
jgi:hypothetical protein